MSVMRDKKGDNLMVDCDCGCDEGLRIQVTRFEDKYCILTYTSGTFYKDQNRTIWNVIATKFKKIWRILRNKDYCYSEIIMDKNDFKEFTEYLSEYNS